MKIVEPSSSFSILVPDNLHEDYDDRVISLWEPGEPLLLQLSSYRQYGTQEVWADERLKDRMAKTPATWSPVEDDLCSDKAVDQAAAEHPDGDATWIHAYFVWPHLSIYVTISGPPEEVYDPDSWARIALKNLSLTPE